MLMNVSGPNKLFSHQTNTVTRQTAIFFSQGRISQIHINLGTRYRESLSSHHRTGSSSLSLLLRHNTLINNTIGSIYRDVSTIFNGSSSCLTTTLGTNDTRNPQLTADNRSMASHSATIGNNSLGFLHGRNPIRSSHFRNQNLAILKFIYILRIQNNMSTACTFSRTGRQALYNYLTFLCGSHFFCCLLFLFFITAGPNSFRTSLQQPNLTISLVNAPLHIHIATIMGFYLLSIAC